MAVNITLSPDTSYNLLPLFGVDATLISEAKAAGVTLGQGSPGKFLIKVDTAVFGSVEVKGIAISLAKNKTLGPASKDAIKFQFEAGMKKAIQYAAYNGITQAPVPVTPKFNPLAQFGKEAKSKAAAPGGGLAYPALASTWLYVPTPSSKMSKVNPVALGIATSCYQPVNGTNSDSVYFCLARLQGVNIGARVLGSKLSIRAEGPELASYAPAFDELGMDNNNGYYSAHFSVANQGLLKKTFGALLGSLGVGKVLEVADFSAFIAGAN